MFGSASRDDEAADANVVTGLNSHPGREVEGLRRRGRGYDGWAVGVTVGVAVGVTGVAVWGRVAVAVGVSRERDRSWSKAWSGVGEAWLGVGVGGRASGWASR